MGGVVLVRLSGGCIVRGSSIGFCRSAKTFHYSLGTRIRNPADFSIDTTLLDSRALFLTIQQSRCPDCRRPAFEYAEQTRDRADACHYEC